jgi:GAF domain-containing protein
VDVTDHVRALHEMEAERERLRLLDHAAQAVAAEVEPRRELAALAASVVPSVADACAIYLWHPASAEHPSGSLTRLVCRISSGLRVDPPRDGATVTLPPYSPVIQAVRRRRTVVTKQTRPGEHEPWLTALPATSLVAVPVEVDDAVHAVVTFVTSDGKQPFQASDISLLREITARATVAVDHALRLQRTTEVSLALQRSFLSAPPGMPGMAIAVRYRPAGAGLEIGGDWYDALRLPDGGLAIAIGDVVGHDLPAATTMAQLRSMLQALACQRDSTPATVLTELNQITAHLDIGSCSTLIYGEVHPEESGHTVFSWANAGHPAPLLLGSTATFLKGLNQPLLGLTPDPYTQDSVVLPPGSTLLFYTDGLIEHRQTEDPLAALAEYASSLGDLPPEELVAALDSWAPSEDDLALLAVKLSG